jgi:hypothetical protein
MNLTPSRLIKHPPSSKNIMTPPLLTPTRLVKHGDKLLSIPAASPRTVDNIFINDLQGFDTIISSIIREKQDNGITFAMKLLGSYKFFYNLTDQEIQNFAYLTGLVAPYDSNKLDNIEADIYKIIFPKFTAEYPDFVELTKKNWVNWKIKILREYIKNGVNDSDHSLLSKIRKSDNFNTSIEKLITEECFDDSVKFNPLIGFKILDNDDKPVALAENETLVINEEGLTTSATKKKYIPIGVSYMKTDNANKTNIVRLNKHLASLLIFVDSVLNKCILKYLNDNKMSYLDEFKLTSFTGENDGNKKKIPKKSIKKSLKKKSKKIKNNIIK